MLSSLGVSIPLGESEIDHVYYVLLFAMTNKEVVRFHVSVNKMIVMQKFEALYHLICKHHGSLNGEFSFAVIEEIFQAWTQQIHNHGIVISLNAKPVYHRNTSYKIMQSVRTTSNLPPPFNILYILVS